MSNKLAILGLGSQSTLFYISELNRRYQEEVGGFGTCPFVMVNSNFNSINNLLPNVSKDLDTIVASYIDQLIKHEAEHILIPNITLHQTIDRLTIPKHIIHPLQLCVDKLTEQGVSHVTLFGTKYTMHSDYIHSFFNQRGITVEVPEKDVFDFIESFRNKVYEQSASPEQIEEYQALLTKYSKLNPVLLACTELSIHNNELHNVFDMVMIQVNEAVRCVVEGGSS